MRVHMCFRYAEISDIEKRINGQQTVVETSDDVVTQLNQQLEGECLKGYFDRDGWILRFHYAETWTISFAYVLHDFLSKIFGEQPMEYEHVMVYRREGSGWRLVPVGSIQPSAAMA
jgi:hypothetical protein